MATLERHLFAHATVFVDTSALFAMAVSRDQSNLGAKEISRQLRDMRARLVTSNFVVAEYHALLVKRVGPRFANAALSTIDRGETQVRPVIESDEVRARQILNRFSDHGYTLTDATSFAMMERLEISIAFTFDNHFAMQRFIVPE